MSTGELKLLEKSRYVLYGKKSGYISKIFRMKSRPGLEFISTRYEHKKGITIESIFYRQSGRIYWNFFKIRKI